MRNQGLNLIYNGIGMNKTHHRLHRFTQIY